MAQTVRTGSLVLPCVSASRGPVCRSSLQRCLLLSPGPVTRCSCRYKGLSAIVLSSVNPRSRAPLGATAPSTTEGQCPVDASLTHIASKWLWSVCRPSDSSKSTRNTLAQLRPLPVSCHLWSRGVAARALHIARGVQRRSGRVTYTLVLQVLSLLGASCSCLHCRQSHR